MEQNASIAERRRDPVHKSDDWLYANLENSSLVIGENSGYMYSNADELSDLLVGR